MLTFDDILCELIVESLVKYLGFPAIYSFMRTNKKCYQAITQFFDTHPRSGGPYKIKENMFLYISVMFSDQESMLLSSNKSDIDLSIITRKLSLLLEFGEGALVTGSGKLVFFDSKKTSVHDCKNDADLDELFSARGVESDCFIMTVKFELKANSVVRGIRCDSGADAWVLRDKDDLTTKAVIVSDASEKAVMKFNEKELDVQNERDSKSWCSLI